MSCPYEDETCGPDFPCLLCCYDIHIERNEQKYADDIAKSYPQIFDKAKKQVHPELKINNERKATGLPPTPKQLAFISSLAAKAHIDTPKPETIDEAKQIIQELLNTTSDLPDPPSDKQINYLRSLAYEKLGSSSEDWVQKIISQGKKAVSTEISRLKGN